MFGTDVHRKVTASHLKREAFLYVRQSTLKQVLENKESTQRQYALRDRAAALGWDQERIRTLDNDLGLSGASTIDREGFKTLVSEVGLGHAGIVMGLEVSRLARNSADWHRLVEICALTDTLILDEDGVYDPAQFNDRLLLGLKGTLSEAELHMLRARLRGGILNKASRGELGMKLPVGLTYDLNDKVCLDPDAQVREAVQLLFVTFKRTGSALAAVRFFRTQGLKFPRRTLKGGKNGLLLWSDLTHSRMLTVLHNPRYAGAFAYGRTQYRKDVSGRAKSKRKPTAEWTFLIKDAHPEYITWSQYEQNLRQLAENSEAHGHDRRKSPPREGPALLQGLVLCGLCGRRMTVRYYHRRQAIAVHYVCQYKGIASATPICQFVPGHTIDAEIASLLIETVSPLNIQTALRVQEEIKRRLDEADSIRKKDVERARYDADHSQRRYMQVDPSNRLVADTLEADWNEKLRLLRDAQETYDRHREEDLKRLSDEKKAEITSLAASFPLLWRDPKTTDRDRKRMARLLIDDVTLVKGKHLSVGVRFRGGATKELSLPVPKNAFDECKTSSQIVADIDRLLETHSDHEIAEQFNGMGLKTGKGFHFNRNRVDRIRQMYNLRSRFDRLRDQGWLTRQELAKKVGVTGQTVQRWAEEGRLEAKTYKKKLCLYADPGECGPKPMTHAERGRCGIGIKKSLSVSTQ
jgi:DNA invertase Pin-like site-specific DNA recombinase